MIFETLIAFTSIKIAWDIIEILYKAHVGLTMGEAGYKVGSAIVSSFKRSYRELLDKIDPTQREMREEKTLYDFKATDADQSQAAQEQVELYLKELQSCIKNLQDAKNYLVKANRILTALIKEIPSDDNQNFLNFLLEFKCKFTSYKLKFHEFTLSIKPPPRELFYVISLSNNNSVLMDRYHADQLEMMHYFDILEETNQQIDQQFKRSLNTFTDTTWPGLASLNLTTWPEQLQQVIETCMDCPENISKTVQALLPENPELATTCAEILKLFASFKENYKKHPYSLRLDNLPALQPLLSTAEKTEKIGQRIFIHAMNEAEISAQEKLLLAKIFLRKPVPRHKLHQIEVRQLAHEMAYILRGWQIKRCDEMLHFLAKPMPEKLPKDDPNLLLFEWLQSKRFEQNSIDLFNTMLVLPGCLSQCGIEAARAKIKNLSLPDNTEITLQKHLRSHWGAIWEENDKLIQFPRFQTNILPTDRFEQYSLSKKFKVAPFVIKKLSVALAAELGRLKALLQESRDNYDKTLKIFDEDKNQANEIQKLYENKNAVERVKLFQISVQAPDSSLKNCLDAYLYKAESINPLDKNRQVPTLDDLAYIIYKGVDPNSICKAASPSQNASTNDKLIQCFKPNLEKADTRWEAWHYACTVCQVSIMPAYYHLFFNNSTLAIENMPESPIVIENTLSMQVFFRNSKKTASLTPSSKALQALPKKIAKETETVFQQLQDYYLLALVRVHPEYRNQLPFAQQLECLFKNLFKFGHEIGKDRLEQVQVFIGDICAVLSEDDVAAINGSIDKFQKDYQDKRAKALRSHKSELYRFMEQAMQGTIADIKSRVNRLFVEVQKSSLDSASVVKRTEEKETVSEVKKEAVQVREQEANKKIEKLCEETEKLRKEKEAERKAKEEAQAREKEAQAKIACLEALLAKQEMSTSSAKPRVAGSPGNAIYYGG